MKQFKTLVALVLALALTMTLVGSAMAAELTAGTKGADKTITITPPNGVADDATNTYTVYKIFNADSNGTAISYKSIDGTAPAGFVVDDAQNVYLGTATDTETGTTGEFTIKVGGATKYIVPSSASELTADQIAAIAAYTGKVAVGTVTITGTTETTVTVPDYGYYYITTTTGSVVTIDSTHKSADVKDKNTVPKLDKKAKQAEDPTYMELDEAGHKAIAQVGTKVPYEATITVGKGAINYKFHDKMGNGLTYNNDVTVSATPAVTIDNWYTVLTTPETGDTITITFKDGIPEDTVITISYTATITSDALSVNPATNTASLDYGDSNSNNSTPDIKVEVYNAKFTVTKKDGAGAALSNAGFVVKNAAGKFYKLADDKKSVTWVDSINDATEYTSDANGAVSAFTGLGKGTYTLVEKTVPAGYNKAADSTFTIKGDDYTADNLEQESLVVNNAGAELPSTGGIGTTIFYIAGAVLVLGAAAIVIARRKAEQD